MSHPWACWMASLTWWTWAWVGSGSWLWTGKPGVLKSMGLQRVGHKWVTELNWPDLLSVCSSMSRKKRCIPVLRRLIQWGHSPLNAACFRHPCSHCSHSSAPHPMGKSRKPPSSFQFSHSVMSNFLRPHGLQHARLPCPLPTPRDYSNSCPLSSWCHPTISSSVVPFSFCFHSFLHQGLFQWVSSSYQVDKYWSSSFSISPSNEYSGLFSFRIDWFDFHAVQGTRQHHGSKASILRHSAFFIVQLSHPYMTTGKTIALTSWTFVDKVMSLLLNMQSKLVITFLPRSKHLLISWLQSPSTVILKPRKIKSATVSTVSPSTCHEVMGLHVLQCTTLC